MLAVVRSIARRTAENSETVDEMLGHFQGRLDAFSRVQAALTRNSQGLVSFISLIEDELVAHALKDGGQVHVEGPEVLLEPKIAERFSLAIHELATNAVKHGALANEQGHIAINWVKEGLNGSEVLIFSWRESGVHIADVEPRRRGFGMELLGNSLPCDLGAETRIALRPEGLRFELRMALPKQAPRPPDRAPGPTRR
jgi:two-component system CheB/CheR fusion protein